MKSGFCLWSRLIKILYPSERRAKAFPKDELIPFHAPALTKLTTKLTSFEFLTFRSLPRQALFFNWICFPTTLMFHWGSVEQTKYWFHARPLLIKTRQNEQRKTKKKTSNEEKNRSENLSFFGNPSVRRNISSKEFLKGWLNNKRRIYAIVRDGDGVYSVRSESQILPVTWRDKRRTYTTPKSCQLSLCNLTKANPTLARIPTFALFLIL